VALVQRFCGQGDLLKQLHKCGGRMNERAAVQVRGRGTRGLGKGVAFAAAPPAALTRTCTWRCWHPHCAPPCTPPCPQTVIHPLLTVLLYLHARGVTHR
jgi:hypothetical protein